LKIEIQSTTIFNTVQNLVFNFLQTFVSQASAEALCIHKLNVLCTQSGTLLAQFQQCVNNKLLWTSINWNVNTSF